MSEDKSSLSDLLKEGRTFPPSEDFVKNANINDPKIYDEAEKDYVAYWEGWAKKLSWSKPWTKALEWNPPFAKWFVDGKLNVSYNCIDRHLEKNRDKVAVIWEGEPGDVRKLTYGDFYEEVTRFANVLKKHGIKKGDRVALYMPMTPELMYACLACTRIGAIHSVVFGGFSTESLRDRINDCGCKALITADYGYRRGKKVALKEAADASVAECPCIEKVFVAKRELDKPVEVEMKEGRDLWWHEEVKTVDNNCPPEEMDAEDVLFILYTSGTTGKPKGIVHTTGGYLTGVHATTKWVFDLKDDDIYWCTADIGWITGHSYIIYGPMSHAATQVMFEGAPDWPAKNRFWELIEKYKVSIFYTAPTAIRAFMGWGTEWIEKHNLSSLRLLGSVGEPINPEAWVWYHKNIGGEKCPIVDTWWQTETGAIMVTPLPGIVTSKPGSATKPFPGIKIDVITEEGRHLETGGGYAAITRPWPSMLRTIYKDDERYKNQYWTKWKDEGTYFAGDGVKRDAEGYLWFLGRVDDVMNVAGHRIGTMEVESALVDHQSVAEAAVVGKEHKIKGTAIAAFVTVKQGIDPTPELAKELRAHVGVKIGAIAKPDEIIFSADLPKTRSGKIMRRLLRDIAEGRALGDVTTLADPNVVAKLQQQHAGDEG